MQATGGDVEATTSTDDHHADTPRAAGSRQIMVVGVAGAVLVFLALGALHALSVPPFMPADEKPHTAYALLVGQGQLPTVHTFAAPFGSSTTKVWTANHPPLYYSLVAWPLRWGADAGRGDLGFFAARFLTLGMAATGVVVSAAVARLLVPPRREVAVLAAGVVGLVPGFVHHAALVHNDALAVLTSSATLALAVLVIIHGPTPSRIGLVSVAAAAAAATRASGLVVAGLAVIASAGAAFLRVGPLPRRLWHAALSGGAVAALVVLASGWFYVRNVALYGDPTGAAELLEMFNREPGPSVVDSVTSPRFWLHAHHELWGRLAGQQLAEGLRLPALTVTAVVVIGLCMALVRRIRGGRGLRFPARLGWAWLVSLVLVGLLALSLAGFVSRGGGAHGRYLYPGLSVLATVVAVGVTGLPGGRHGLSGGLVLAAGVGLNVAVWSTFVERIAGEGGLAGAAAALRAAEIDPPSQVLLPVAFGILIGLVLQVYALWRLGEASAREP